MFNDRRKRLFSLFLITVLFAGFYVYSLKGAIDYPQQVKLFEGEKHTLDIKFPLLASDSNAKSNIIQLSETGKLYNNETSINPVKIGRANIEVKLLGILPIRNLTVDVIPKIKIIPGGQSIGVRLNTKGVLIIDLDEIEAVDGKKYNPGYDAGLRIGDSILEINHEKVKNADHVTELISKNKTESVILTVKRNEKTMSLEIRPIKSAEDGEYRLGLWVRDKTAGVGTMTFYHPDSMKFGALGHAITDVETGQLLSVDSGQVVKSKVASVEQGKKGKPGEIKGIFYESSNPIGNLQKNTDFGIYGEAFDHIENPLYKEPLEVGFQNQVKEGKATILTTIDNNKIEEYEIYIEKVNHQRSPSTKSMIIRVTDPVLLAKSGGIVQGMSGSPTIQDGKIIGAVTHVFVHDPTKGYGLFIEWMLNECEIEVYNNSQMATND